MTTTYIADGLTYKLGVHNKMYRWSGFDWISSSKTLAEVKERAERQSRSMVNVNNATYQAKLKKARKQRLLCAKMLSIGKPSMKPKGT